MNETSNEKGYLIKHAPSHSVSPGSDKIRITELKLHNGRPALFINGQPHDGIFCSTPAKYMRNFIDAGFDIFDTHPGTPEGWIGRGQYDYAATDRYIQAYLDQKPDAKLIIRIWMGGWGSKDTGYWWAQENPAEVCGVTEASASIDNYGREVPSFASLKYRTESGEALKRVIEHIEKRFGDNVVAYGPGMGECGEWFQWYAFRAGGYPEDKNLVMGDYSAPMKAAWQGYLRDKYGTIEELNSAHKTQHGDFGAVPIPGPQKRNRACQGHIRAPDKEQALLDDYEVFNRQPADTLLYYAAKTKEGCGRKKVVMAFYGYLWICQPGGGVPSAAREDRGAVSGSGRECGRMAACVST